MASCIRLVVSDMDGTLLSSDQRISAKDANAVRAVQEAGVGFAVVTGRSFSEAREKLSEWDLLCHVATMNGCEIRDPEGEVLWARYMDHGVAEAVIETFRRSGVYAEIYTTAGILTVSTPEQCRRAVATKIAHFVPDETFEQGYARAERSSEYTKLQRVDSPEDIWAMGAEVGKVVCFWDEPEVLAGLRDELPRHTSCATAQAFPINVEVTGLGASKGDAVRRMARAVGCELAEVLAIGDGMNDLPMLREVGTSVAMGNAPAAVRAAATHVTLPNDLNGVARALGDLVLAPGHRPVGAEGTGTPTSIPSASVGAPTQKASET